LISATRRDNARPKGRTIPRMRYSQERLTKIRSHPAPRHPIPEGTDRHNAETESRQNLFTMSNSQTIPNTTHKGRIRNRTSRTRAPDDLFPPAKTSSSPNPPQGPARPHP